MGTGPGGRITKEDVEQAAAQPASAQAPAAAVPAGPRQGEVIPMRAMRRTIAERMHVVSRVLGLPREGVDAVLEWVLEFRKELGIPHSLAEIGVTLRNPEEIGREAAIDPSAGGNPVAVDAAALERIFRAAVVGDLTLKG